MLLASERNPVSAVCLEPRLRGGRQGLPSVAWNCLREHGKVGTQALYLHLCLRRLLLKLYRHCLNGGTVLRGQGSSAIDQKLDRRLCQVTAMAGGSFGAVAAVGPEWQGRIQFPSSPGAQLFPAPSFPTLPPVIRALSRERSSHSQHN